LANELQVGLKLPVLDKPGDLAGLLTNLEEEMFIYRRNSSFKPYC
jgi:Holliday junction resolvasome RuvABC ATP-dependent DNA helicase subunit